MELLQNYLPTSSSDWSLAGLGLAILIIAVLTIQLIRRKKNALPIQEVSKNDIPSLLTEPELACFNTLDDVAGKDYYIMAKVSLSDIAIVKKGVDQTRWLGIRPNVRGVAMNPVDHPHGGGEGRTSGGRHPVTPWGVPTKGHKTRKKNKASNRDIIRRRNQK